jgi:hypothetical protein
MLQDMQQLGVIDESDSPWSFPIGLIQKKNWDHCFCIDCRKLNDVPREDCFPLPRIDVTLDMFTRAKWLSILDLRSGYWQKALYPDDVKTALSTSQALWQFTVMPFSLFYAPVTFEWLMETVVKGLTYKLCLLCLDMVMNGCTFWEQLQNLEKVFQRYQGTHLKLNPEKCQFFHKEVQNLCHIVCQQE